MDRWKQKEFYISTFDPMIHNATPEQAEKFIRWTKEANFNMVEFTFRNREEVTIAVEACEKVGMQSLVQDPCFGGVGSGSFLGGRCLPSEETVREAVDYYSRFSQIMGFYVWDEPQATVFEDCRRSTDLFRRLAPDKLAFSVIYPSYGVYTWKDANGMDWSDNGYTRYVNGYLETVDPDVFSMDYYVFYMNRRIHDLRYYDLWRDLGYCRKCALELNKPQWFYYQGHGDFEPKDGDAIAEMNPDKVRVQMYAALSYGVKQLSCFCSSPLLFDGEEKNPRFYEPVKKMNRRIRCIGNELLDKVPVKIYHTGISEEYIPLYFLDRLEEDGVIASAGDELIVGRLEQEDTQYLMVTNQRFESSNEGCLTLMTPYRIAVFDEDTGEYTDLGVDTRIFYTLTPGHGQLYRLEKA